MKNKVNELMKRLISSIVVMAVILAGSFIINTEVRAAVNETMTDNGIVYKKYDDWNRYWGKEIPVYTGTDSEGYGYVFGGWFMSEDENTYIPIEATENVGDSDVYAKFVPAYVLSVKCQNRAGTKYTADNSGSTNLKVISSVDSANYDAYGFELSIVALNQDGSIKEEPTLFSAGEAEANVVFEKFKIYDEDKDEDGQPDLVKTAYPSEVFGRASKYFSAWRVDDIPEVSYGTIIWIRPYWKTMDGMTVYGLSKYAHVEDGLLQEIEGETYRYVNVPINIRDTKAVAAGIVNVDYSSNTNLSFYGVEGGTVFEEISWNNKSGNLKLAGNVSDISDNKQTNEMFANVRFLVSSNSVSDFLNGFSFQVTDETFSNIDEQLYDSKTYDVWDVKY